jgi:cystathionine beta-lyase/cystathionine gamma-synthase
MSDVFQGKRPGHVYTRYGNPTIEATEEKLAELEGAERGIAFASGMAAISTSLLSVLKPGDEIVSIEDIYGGTFELFTSVLPAVGISVDFVPTGDILTSGVISRRKPAVVYVESPTNPLLRVVDIAGVSKAARKTGSLLFVDGTFATPVLQKPLTLGADVVVHSGSKYLGGHSDLISGMVATSNKLGKEIERLRRVLGPVMDPHAAWLLGRGMKTLAVRMGQHCENALRLAEFLESDPNIGEVFYPGLASHPDHPIAARQMSRSGGMVSFDIRGGAGAARRFVEALTTAKLAPSLGGIETLVSISSLTSHRGVPRETRLAMGISDSLIRVSAGIEDPDDLIVDFRKALSSARKK